MPLCHPKLTSCEKRLYDAREKGVHEMIWIFLAVVVALAVFNEGFRKVVYWCGGIAAAIVLIAAMAIK
jgi:hypothetical protein